MRHGLRRRWRRLRLGCRLWLIRRLRIAIGRLVRGWRESWLCGGRRRDLPADVTFNLDGTAGQSFGAFTVEGMKLVLDGSGERFCR